MSLKQFVFWNLLKTALIPLFCIECALVGLYFWINSYNQNNLHNTVRMESVHHIADIVNSQVRAVSQELRTICSLSLVLQAETASFFTRFRTGCVRQMDAATTFARAANGVYYKENNNGGGSLFYSALTAIGPEQAEKAARSEVLDPIYKHIHDANRDIAAVYLNTFDSMNRYFPFIDKVYDQYPAKMDITLFNFYYLADARHNPKREPVWTEMYLDPAGQGWMMSCIAPVYYGNFLEGVVGIDITINNFLEGILNLQLPWAAKAFLVDGKGTIMAMPPEVEKALGLNELRNHSYQHQVAENTFKPDEFNLFKARKGELASTIKLLMDSSKNVTDLELDDHGFLLAAATEPMTGWKLMVLADKEKIFQTIAELDRNTRSVGLAAIGGMVLFYVFFFVYLTIKAGRVAQEIAAPVGEIAARSGRILENDGQTKVTTSEIEELNTLHDNYAKMVVQIRSLHENLRSEVNRANLELEERRQTQEALRRSEQKLTAIFNHTFQFIGLLAPNGTVIRVNKTALDFINCRESDVVGKSFSQTPWWNFSKDMQEKLEMAIKDAAAGNLVRFEAMLHDRDGAFQYADVSINPVRDESGGVIMLIPEARLITELKKTEQQLREAKDIAESSFRAKTEFLANMNHEFKTPLNHIIGFTGIVLEQNFGELNYRQQKYLNNVLTSGHQLLDLINSVLDLADIEAGEQILEPKTINIRTLLEHSMLMIRDRATKKGLALEPEFGGLPDTIRADERKLKQIMYNLLANAVKFTEKGGKIVISARAAPGNPQKLQISVTDNGVGVAPENLERIFTNFEQVDGSMTRSFRGSGLGLSLTRKLVELHGGSIQAESEGLGKGTKFTVVIPVQTSSAPMAVWN